MSIKSKKCLMNALDEKIFFVIKYWIMSAFQGLAIVVIVFFVGTVNVLQLIALGVLLFFISLLISKHFHSDISKLALWIAKKLDKYPKAKALVAKGI